MRSMRDRKARVVSRDGARCEAHVHWDVSVFRDGDGAPCPLGATSVGDGVRRRRPLDRLGRHFMTGRALATAALSSLMASSMLVSIPLASAGQCSFTQDCFQTGVDTECTPQPVGEGSSSESFPLDAAHGFGVQHDRVWDGSMEDPSTGLCASGGTPDADGRCIVDFVPPRGLSAVAPVICPQYEEDGCCSWQQNYALYQNLRTLVDSFGSTTGCLACAVNLVRLWCAMVCSPRQASFLSIHDPPFAQRTDDLTGSSGRVLQADVTLDADLACRIYDSCKDVAIVGETSAMQSGLGLLRFQMQTGAVGHGEYFFLDFANVSTAAEEETRKFALGFSSSSSSQALDLETLMCDSFYDPGSSTVPFPYPYPSEGGGQSLTSCRCDYCAAACSDGGGGGVYVDTSDERPIPVFDGFGFQLVGGVYAAVLTCGVALWWWRETKRRRQLY